MQVKSGCIPCRSVSYAWLKRRFILPPALVLIGKFLNDHFTFFKIPEYEVASISVIKQVKLRRKLCHSVSYAWLQRQGWFILPPPEY